MLIRANAKINWTLDTVGVRADGYHLLDMLMQSISLHDTLTLEPAEDVTFSATLLCARRWRCAGMRARRRAR